ncbi:hypothetical protein BDQ94DRAFT_152205, partial [Aspergillus welwitschiae]
MSSVPLSMYSYLPVNLRDWDPGIPPPSIDSTRPPPRVVTRYRLAPIRVVGVDRNFLQRRSLASEEPRSYSFEIHLIYFGLRSG